MGAKVKLAEVPPGPPVLSTLVAEVHGNTLSEQIALAKEVEKIFYDHPGVVEVDIYMEAPQEKVLYRLMPEKAIPDGIFAENIAYTLRLAFSGLPAGTLESPDSRHPIPLVIKLPRSYRTQPDKPKELYLHQQNGRMVALNEITTLNRRYQAPAIYHKNLARTTYVIADVSGAYESSVYAILDLKEKLRG